MTAGVGRSRPAFVDTNVLVYAHDLRDRSKHETARRLLEDLWGRRAGVVSTQVLSEFYSIATTRLRPAMTPTVAREVVVIYATWPVIVTDVPALLDASRLQERHRLAWWDALVIDAARRAGADLLYTEDLPSAPTIDGLKIVNPFA
jgi:predicted nucleic acid-binding protein